MKAGRELDALVAEKVMGWTFDDVMGWASPDGKRTGQPSPPPYSLDIAAAWEVVRVFESREAIIELKFNVGWTSELYVPHTTLLVTQGQVGLQVLAEGETAPHAICLAALKAVGVEIVE